LAALCALLLLPRAALPAADNEADNDAAAFAGIWSGSITTPEHEYWRYEDFPCFAGCPKAGYEYLQALVDDPANDALSSSELSGRATAFMRSHLAGISTARGVELQQANTTANDLTIHCAPYGYVREATNPLPLQMSWNGDILTIKYEEWNLLRTVYMDGRDFPQNLEPTMLGYSIGHFEDGALLIETRGVLPDIYYSFQSGGAHSEQASGVERYTLVSGGTALRLDLTVQDPLTLTQPFVLTKQWVATPDLVLLEDSCEDVPGEF
jgi:hypothetical protein